MRDMSFYNLPKSTRRLLRFSQCRLFLTSFVIEIWPVLTLPLFYLGLGLLDLFSYMPWWLHALTLLAFIGTMLFFIRRAILRLKWPDVRDIMRKLEISSHVAHRPLNNLTDHLFHGTRSEDQKLLWKKHLLRAREQLTQIRLLQPDRSLKQQDPRRLGFLAILIFAVGFYFAGDNRNMRITQALTPPQEMAEIVTPSWQPPLMEVTAWVTPPAYAGGEAQYLHSGPLKSIGGKITLPQDSTLTMHISKTRHFPPRIYVDGARKDLIFNNEGHYSIDIDFTEAGVFEVVMKRFFLTRAHWTVTSVPDQAPQIKLEEKAAEVESQEIEWSYSAADDYGIAKLDMYISPDSSLQSKLDKAPLTPEEKRQYHFPIAVPQDPPLRQLAETRTTDMTESVFAGQAVVLSILGEDTGGQIGQSNPFKTVLPMRQFKHPVAKALVEIRQTLAWSDNAAERLNAWTRLRGIATAPDQYRDDITVFLALSVAHMTLERLVASPYSRMNQKTEDQWLKRLKNVRELLWKTALHIEDGSLAVAARDLRNALEQLAEKMEKGDMTEEEFQKLAAEMQETMARYMQALSEELREKMQNEQKSSQENQQMSQELMDRLAEKMDVGSMFQQWQQMSEGGSKENMQKMIEQMRKFMEQMDPEKLKNARPFDNKEFENIGDLQKLIEQQQELIEKTQEEKDRQEQKQEQKKDQQGKQEKKEPQNKKDGDKSKELAKKQGEIRKELGDISKKMDEKLGEVPEPMAEADQFMKQAGDGLEEPDIPAALKSEQEALEALQKGMDQELERLADLLENVMMIGSGGQPQGPQDGERDPLGRQDGDNIDTSDLDLPDEKERTKIQEIIRELRQRSNDYQRPDFEKEYYDRLLERF
ncbi:MAG: DUF4175 family protein [Proteobacteria bacterium]|nr:DUF4175 family protein [Pseudomonadota bacterium]